MTLFTFSLVQKYEQGYIYDISPIEGDEPKTKREMKMLKFIKYNIVSLVFGAFNFYTIYMLGTYNQNNFKHIDVKQDVIQELQIKMGLCLENDINNQGEKLKKAVLSMVDVLEEHDKFIDTLTEAIRDNAKREEEKNEIIRDGFVKIFSKFYER